MKKLIADTQNKFIWCWVSKDGLTITPEGDAKTYQRAMSLSQRKYPEKYKLFELIEYKGAKAQISPTVNG